MTDETAQGRGPDILIRYEPALSSTSDHPTGATPMTPSTRPAPALSVGPAGENAANAAEAAEPTTQPPEEQVTTEAEPGATAEQQATAETPPGEAAPAKKPFSERISDIAKDRDAAKAEAAAAVARAAEASRLADERFAALAAQVEKLVQQTAKPDPADVKPARPDRTKFDDVEAYDRAVAEHDTSLIAWAERQGARNAAAEAANAEKANAEAAALKAQRDSAEAQAVKVVTQYNESVTKARAAHADFDAKVVNDPNLVITTPTAMALMQAPDGAEIAYYLATHPEEAARVAAAVPEASTPWEAQMAMTRAAVEIGRISEKLAAKPKPEVSKTPAPIAPVGGRSSAGTKALADMTMDEYAATVPEYVAAREARAPGKRGGPPTTH